MTPRAELHPGLSHQDAIDLVAYLLDRAMEAKSYRVPDLDVSTLAEVLEHLEAGDVVSEGGIKRKRRSA